MVIFLLGVTTCALLLYRLYHPRTHNTLDANWSPLLISHAHKFTAYTVANSARYCPFCTIPRLRLRPLLLHYRSVCWPVIRSYVTAAGHKYTTSYRFPDVPTWAQTYQRKSLPTSETYLIWPTCKIAVSYSYNKTYCWHFAFFICSAPPAWWFKPYHYKLTISETVENVNKTLRLPLTQCQERVIQPMIITVKLQQRSHHKPLAGCKS